MLRHSSGENIIKPVTPTVSVLIGQGDNKQRLHHMQGGGLRGIKENNTRGKEVMRGEENLRVNCSF